jgi:hypothetical protein
VPAGRRRACRTAAPTRMPARTCPARGSLLPSASRRGARLPVQDVQQCPAHEFGVLMGLREPTRPDARTEFGPASVSRARPTSSAVSTWKTSTPQLIKLRARLVAEGAQRVVLESTSDYWRPMFCVLAERLDVVLVNASDVMAGAEVRCEPALVAVERSILTAAWHVLTTGAFYQDPGPDYYKKRHPERRVQQASTTSPTSATRSCPPRDNPQRKFRIKLQRGPTTRCETPGSSLPGVAVAGWNSSYAVRIRARAARRFNARRSSSLRPPQTP